MPEFLQLPRKDQREVPGVDYSRMVEDGLLLDEAKPFDVLLERCRALAEKVNSIV